MAALVFVPAVATVWATIIRVHLGSWMKITSHRTQLSFPLPVEVLQFRPSLPPTPPLRHPNGRASIVRLKTWIRQHLVKYAICPRCEHKLLMLTHSVKKSHTRMCVRAGVSSLFQLVLPSFSLLFFVHLFTTCALPLCIFLNKEAALVRLFPVIFFFLSSSTHPVSHAHSFSDPPRQWSSFLTTFDVVYEIIFLFIYVLAHFQFTYKLAVVILRFFPRPSFLVSRLLLCATFCFNSNGWKQFLQTNWVRMRRYHQRAFRFTLISTLFWIQLIERSIASRCVESLIGVGDFSFQFFDPISVPVGSIAIGS